MPMRSRSVQIAIAAVPYPRLFLVVLTLASAMDAHAVDVISHRANSCGATENSHGAIAASWSIGADAVELDVRVSKDGVAYIFHDDEIDDVPLADLDYAEVQRRAGSIATPKLVSALGSANEEGFYVLDLKDAGISRSQHLVEAVRESRIAQQRLTFQSDSVAALSTLRRQLPKSRYFFLSRLRRIPPFFLAPGPENLLGHLSGHEVDGVSMKGRAFIDRNFVETLKAGGLRVYVWTINDMVRAQYYREIGVDAIITDNAEQILMRFHGVPPSSARCESGPAGVAATGRAPIGYRSHGWYLGEVE